jgi:hypothetical protein
MRKQYQDVAYQNAAGRYRLLDGLGLQDLRDLDAQGRRVTSPRRDARRVL